MFLCLVYRGTSSKDYNKSAIRVHKIGPGKQARDEMALGVFNFDDPNFLAIVNCPDDRGEDSLALARSFAQKDGLEVQIDSI